MSKRRDPRDEAIAYVMGLSVVEAAMFVQVLASVVKARNAKELAAPPRKVATPAPAAANSTPAKPRASRALREVKVSTPEELAQQAVQDTPSQPDILEGASTGG